MTLAPLRRVDRIGHGPPNILYLALFLPCIKVHGAVQTQSLHLVFERRTDRRLIFNNVQGPGRLMAGRSGGGFYEQRLLVSHYVSSIPICMYLFA